MLRKKKSKNRKNNLQEEVVQGYLRGLNHMIAGQPNQAIAEFSKTASISSTLPELYLKLGDLFREKGDIERAIRLHQGVTVRSGVSPEIKIQALNGLARDYRSGGFIDRAVATFEEVLKQDRDHKQALRSLGTIYLEECEW
ncbi:MAG: tetratricopeptide repeat protein, partial [bacterium]